MKEENAIEVKGVYKRFNLYTNNRKIKDYLIYHRDKDKKYRYVLNDISFEVKKGEVFGIIGRNGSGKSTILKMLTRILRPNSGTIETNGRISCLIELGAGFHPDMTGRENIYINASILGLSKKEIDRRIGDIIEFSELGDFIDKRIRNYSSGMYLRLAFSIAINVDADVMIVDEILSVGDISFQDKCLKKMESLKNSGVTIVLVTHIADQAKMLCEETIWIDSGTIKERGATEEVCNHYIEAML